MTLRELKARGDFYSIRSERLLTDQPDYNLLFPWFVGLEMDERIWDPTVFTKNRDRLLNQDITVERGKDLLGSENERHANRQRRERPLMLPIVLEVS